jgi:HNH endonuclease
MKPRHDLSADYVRSILDYDPVTGELRWKQRTDIRACSNSRDAGKIAGNIMPKGHIRVTIKNKRYLAHRLIWLIMTGEWPKFEVDHKDLDGSNNRWDNLREATHSQNVCNGALRSNNASGFKGVYWDKKMQKWRASIRLSYKLHHLGFFDAPEIAHQAYSAASTKMHGEFGRTA